eukprot:1466567-Prymnesium_polylepis.1
MPGSPTSCGPIGSNQKRDLVDQRAARWSRGTGAAEEKQRAVDAAIAAHEARNARVVASQAMHSIKEKSDVDMKAVEAYFARQ